MVKNTRLWIFGAVLVYLNFVSNPSYSSTHVSIDTAKCLAIVAVIDVKNNLTSCNLALDKSTSSELKEQLLLSRAHILLLFYKPKEAMEDLESARKLNPNSPLILSKIANYKQFEDPEEAAKLYIKALSHANKNDAVILNSRFLKFILSGSNRASKNGNYIQAISLINSKLMHTDSLSIQHQLLTYRGRMNLQLGQKAEAFADWETAIDLAPNIPWAYLARGLHLYAKNQTAAALKDFEASYKRRSAATSFILPKEPYVKLLQQSGLASLRDQDLFLAAEKYRRILEISSTSDLQPLMTIFWRRLLRIFMPKN